MGSRTTAGITVVLAILVAGGWFAQRGTADSDLSAAAPIPDTIGGAPDRAEAAGMASAPTVRARDLPQANWLDSLSGRDGGLEAEDGDPHAITLRGRLTVRQQPWIHPANVSVRITRSFLDTVVPTELGTQDELAPTRDDPATTTDAEGRFALRFAPADGGLFFLIDRDGPWADFQRVRDVPHIGGELDLGEVFLDDRGGVAGRVLDRDGHPVANAVVRGVDEPLLGLASPLGDARSERLAGVEDFRADGSVAFGALPAWVVRRDRFLPFPTTTSDATGKFVLKGLRPGQQDVLVTTDRDGRRRLAAVQVAWGRMTDVGDIVLRDAILHTVQFVDENRNPWVGAEVVPLMETGFGPPPIRTDGKGRGTLVLDRTQGFDLAFAYPDAGPWLRLPIRSPIVMSDRITIPRPRPTVVTLLDQHDTPIANARVRLFAQGELFRPVDRALPAAMQPWHKGAGVYHGQAPHGIELAIVASAPGFAPAIATGLPGGTNVLRMLPLSEVIVRTRDSDGRAVPDVVVRIQAHRNPELTFAGTEWDLLANDRARVGRTDRNGELRVPVWDTFLSFSADHPHYALSAGPKLRPRPGQTIDLLLRKNGSVHGTLLVHGRPAAKGYRVRARMRPPAAHELAASGWLAEACAVTGDDGTFVFASLDAGQWEFEPSRPPVPGLTAVAAASTRYRKGIVSLEEGQDVWFQFEAEPWELDAPRLTGSIRVDGVQQAGARVRVRKASATNATGRDRAKDRWRERVGRGRSSPFAEAQAETGDPVWDQLYTTDAFGTFAFAGLAPDTDYEVRIDLPVQDRLQFLRREVVRTPRAGEPLPTNVAFDVQSGGLTVFAARQGRACANAMLRLRQVAKDGVDAACYEILTDANGQCTVEALPAGRWTIEPVHGGACTPAEVTIEPGARPALSVQVAGR